MFSAFAEWHAISMQNGMLFQFINAINRKQQTILNLKCYGTDRNQLNKRFQILSKIKQVKYIGILFQNKDNLTGTSHIYDWDCNALAHYLCVKWYIVQSVKRV